MRRLALALVTAMVFTACSADATVSSDATAEIPVVEDVAAVEDVADVAEVDDDAEAPDAEAPTAPQSVTASTVHESSSDDFPDIIGAQATPEGDGTWRFDVTVSSPYDTPQRYADAWRVVGPDGTEYGIRVLTHDHASEQPFTRSQGGIAIPTDVTTVTVEGRDQANGWGGGFLTVELAG